ncbi:MAG: hypothetical protein ACAI25_02875 [Planctomycetota bacterium]
MIRRAMVVALVLGACGTAVADTVVLKNGRRIEGRLVQDNEREVTIETQPGMIMRFERKTVASVERDVKQTPDGVKAPVPEDIGVPEFASEDEIARLKSLVPPLRDTARRYAAAKKQLEEAEKAGSKDVPLLSDRVKEFTKQLDGLKTARANIEQSAADRLVKAQKAARADAELLRADTEKLRGSMDAVGLADRAVKLRARVPENARDPRHGPLLGEAVHAMEASGAVDEILAKDAKTQETKVAGYVRAGDHFAWCFENQLDPKAGEKHFKRAVAAYAEAHRAAGFDATAVERSLRNLQAYRACASLVEDRLGERRWGPELAESEAGQYRIELKDKVLYGNEPPGTKDAKAARERRDRTENRAKKDEKGNSVTILVKVTRWYELVWDPKKKRWARESGVTELESKRLVPLLVDAQEKLDALGRAKAELEAANRAAFERHQALLALRRKVELAEATEETLDKQSKEDAEKTKQVTAAQEAVTQAQAALGVKQRELVELEKEIEKARRGE